MLPSRFGPTSAVFRAYRIAEDGPRLSGMPLSTAPYDRLNARIDNNETLDQSDEIHVIATRKPRPKKRRASTRPVEPTPAVGPQHACISETTPTGTLI